MTIIRAALAAALALGFIAAPLAAEAQQAGKVPRIGFLSGFSAPATAPWYQALDQGLRDLGWIEGQTIRIEPRYADGRTERLPELAAELVRLRVDLIVTTETVTSVAARQASDTIPIVMASGDPVLAGLAKSLARPGGNVTGVSQLNLTELAGKRLELLREFVPGLARLTVLSDADIRLVTWNAIEAPRINWVFRFNASKPARPGISTRPSPPRPGHARERSLSCPPPCSSPISSALPSSQRRIACRRCFTCGNSPRLEVS